MFEWGGYAFITEMAKFPYSNYIATRLIMLSAEYNKV